MGDRPAPGRDGLSEPEALRVRKDTAAAEARLGFAMAASAYAFWGCATLFWRYLAHVPAYEVIAHRAIWSLVFVGVYLWLKGRIGEVGAAMADRRALGLLALSALVLFSNWGVFVWGIQHGYVLETSFGYFINPLMSVVIGFVLLGERLNRAQTLAILLAGLAVVAQAIALGAFPLLSVYLAGTFAAYGYFRKINPVRSAAANLIESLLHLLPAIAILAFVTAGGQGHFTADPTTMLLLVLTGPITALPLILFGAAAQRLPLAVMGLLQYIVPSIQFALAITIFGQELSWTRLLTFAIIWVALAIFTVDVLGRPRRVTA